ncbi:MAG TPA: GNAT family N-acetyltransferase [Syntrophales bacterium]|nr:GNAT family N-acetyltransferase [Syntrophales bacterium]HPX56567.1 GNAT family N-acetyltransferase [Syntrophales bacterium]
MAALERWKKIYPEKFADEENVFRHIHRGDYIFVASGCGEPQYLVSSLVQYVENNPKAFFDTEIIQIYSFGIAPYTDVKFKHNFRHNSFFIGDNTRASVNSGLSDYTPVSLSDVPALMNTGSVHVDVALIQTSYPDDHGYMSLGVSVDIVKTAMEKASVVIAQANSEMPRIHGDGFIHIKDVTFIVPHDEPLLEIKGTISTETAELIGNYVARLIRDGDTIQVGYGNLPNAVVSNLHGKKHLGIHTEMISDGLMELIKSGAVDNSRKTLNRGATIASFAMGTRELYEFLDDNPSVVFRTIGYTNNPVVIARHENMVAINSALEIDLSGQATSESIGNVFYSGIGGHYDFMRGALLARNGKTILAMQSTTENDTICRIVPCLKESAGVTLNRGDVRYVVTEYGIAYLHGKNVRERAMALISIAHPNFRPWLIEEAKKRGLIFRDQVFIPGKRGEYPEHLEIHRTLPSGIQLFLRPIKFTDEPLLKDFLYSLSEESMYRRFISKRTDIPHEQLQQYVVIDYTKEMAILGIMEHEEYEEIVGVGRYYVDETIHTAEVAFAVRDDYQRKGIGTMLLSYITYLAKRQGLLGFTAEVLANNQPMLHTFEKAGFTIEKRMIAGVFELKMIFND